MKPRMGRGVRLAVVALALVAACKSRGADNAAGSNAAGSSAASAASAAGSAAAGSGAAGSAAAGSDAVAAGSGAGSAAAAPPEADNKLPELRARELLEQQVALLAAGKNAELLALFAPGAVVLAPEARPADPSLDLVGRIGKPGAPARATIGKVAVGSNLSAIWLTAELAVTAGDGPARNVRAVEVLDGAQGWKIAVASFAETGKPRRAESSPGAVPAPTEAGPIAALLAAPEKLAASLLDDEDASVFVLGSEPGERGDGLVNAKLLAYKWRKAAFELAADDKVHEVRAAGWGYAIGHVNRLAPPGAPFRTSGLVVAIPSTSGGWSTVAAVFNAL